MRKRGSYEVTVLSKEGACRLVTELEGLDGKEQLLSQPTDILASKGADEVRRYNICKREKTGLGQ